MYNQGCLGTNRCNNGQTTIDAQETPVPVKMETGAAKLDVAGG